MAEASERIITDDTGKEILEALRNIPGVTGATSIDHGGTGATNAEDALRNLGAQPLLGIDVEEELKGIVKSVNSLEPDENGDVSVTHVLTADNLTADDAQDIFGEFIERTTGGTVSLKDGKSWLSVIAGNSVRTGHEPESTSVYVNNMPRDGISGSIDWDAFRNAVGGNSSTMVFSYNGNVWSEDPATYGITVEGYPIKGDTITASLTAKSESYNVLSDAGITASFDWATYEAKYEQEPVTYFSYNSGAWNVNLADYGITVTGTPIDGDVINVFYSPEQHSMHVNSQIRGAALAAYMNWDKFKKTVNYETSTIVLTYDTEWSDDLAEYGVAISGTPIKGDQITLYFTEEVRGHIANAKPTRFVSTGWNLYNHTKGYARVLRYSEQYGFKIGGTYTSASFCEDLEGTPTPLVVDSDGNFTISADGYVFVTGGDDTSTVVYMTWSDWLDGHPGVFQAYTESEIDITAIHALPNGLCSVGSVRDQIDFDLQEITFRIERLDYTVENYETIKASGRDYIYDEAYIYAVRENPITVAFSSPYELDAYDHGMEYVDGTSVPMVVHLLYGHNLRDKLRTDVVTISEQSLNAAQKEQVRKNLGLGGSDVLPVANGGTGASEAADARTNLGLGSAAVKNVASGITSSDLGLPTAVLIRTTMNQERTPQFGANDGHNLKDIFGTPAALFAAVKSGDFSKIHNNDYWPITLTGSYKDYAANATKSFNGAVVKLGVNINHYWKYGDSGAIANGVNHILFSSLDLLPVTLQYRNENSTWYDEAKTNPWLGSHLYQTLNNATDGIIKIVLNSELGPYLYAGPNGAGMRWLAETKAKGATTTTGWGWQDRGKLFLPTEQEVWGHTIFADPQYHSKGCCLQWPQFIGSRRYVVKGLGDGGSRSTWWCESSATGSAADFCVVADYGRPSTYGAAYSFGVPLCFLAFDPS